MATTYDKASLVMIPSGYKDDKLYSVKPTDGSGDFTFSRDGSGASPATRVNASGLIEKGRENVLLQSNTFDTTWLNSGSITKTSGQSGYDGSSDAWRIDKGSAAAFIRQTNSQSGLRTLSVYAKAGTSDWILIVIDGSPDAFQYFDLSNGVLGATGTNITAKITRVGATDWYRCSVTGADTYTEVKIYPAEGDNNVSATSGNIYIQDAQLEQGLVATDYIETTTAPVSAGLLGDMPRLDYSGGATCPSLLLEPSRVNLVAQSEFYGGSDWSITRCGVVTNTSETLSPEGLYNASKMTSTDASESYAQDNVTLATSGVFSFFAKKGDLDYCHSLVWDLAANGRRQWFNLATGEVGGTTIFGSGYDKVDAGMEDYGNGWWRCWFAWNNGNTTSAVRINISSADTTLTSPVNSYGYFYGAQVESAVSYPTSYIPTYGSASTRGADIAYVTSATDLIGQTEGTLFFEGKINGQESYNRRLLTISDGGTANKIEMFNPSNSLKLRSVGVDANVLQFDIESGSILTIGETFKVAIAYAANDFVMYLNGTQIGTDTSGSIPTTNKINFGRGDNAFNAESPVNQALLFKTRLTNAELAALTTI